MRHLIFVSLSLISIIFFGCGSSVNIQKTDAGEIPEWYLNVPTDPQYIYASNTATSQDMQLSVDKATVAARTEIASQLEVKLASRTKFFQEEIGQGDQGAILEQLNTATKTVVSQVMSGTAPSKKQLVKDGDNWRAYILVAYPLGAANQALMDQIKQNKALYTEIKASKAFEELEKDVKDYENKQK